MEGASAATLLLIFVDAEPSKFKAAQCTPLHRHSAVLLPRSFAAGEESVSRRTGPSRSIQRMVGMTKAESWGAPPSSVLSGQRAVTVLVLVQKRTPSMPCWLMSPKAERFQPPKV